MKTARTKSKVYVFKENTQPPPTKPISHYQEFGRTSCVACGKKRFTTAFISETDQFDFDYIHAKLNYFCADLMCMHQYNIRRKFATSVGLKVGDQIPVKSR